MSQPKWKFLDNFGGDPADGDRALLVFEDETGVYEPEMVRVDMEGDGYVAHRVVLERVKIVQGHLVPAGYQADWPHPVAAYKVWFADHYKDLLFIDDLCSDDTGRRACAYNVIYDDHGWANGDEEPQRISAVDLAARFPDLGA